jgi:hypothetical protein
MKPRPTESKSKREGSTPQQGEAPAKREPQVPTRTIFVKDAERSVTGYTSFEEADRERQKLGKDPDGQRARVRYRRRTERWDLLVKVAKQVPIEVPKAIGE